MFEDRKSLHTLHPKDPRFSAVNHLLNRSWITSSASGRQLDVSNQQIEQSVYVNIFLRCAITGRDTTIEVTKPIYLIQQFSQQEQS